MIQPSLTRVAFWNKRRNFKINMCSPNLAFDISQCQCVLREIIEEWSDAGSVEWPILLSKNYTIVKSKFLSSNAAGFHRNFVLIKLPLIINYCITYLSGNLIALGCFSNYMKFQSFRQRVWNNTINKMFSFIYFMIHLSIKKWLSR